MEKMAHGTSFTTDKREKCSVDDNVLKLNQIKRK